MLSSICIINVYSDALKSLKAIQSLLYTIQASTWTRTSLCSAVFAVTLITGI